MNDENNVNSKDFEFVDISSSSGKKPKMEIDFGEYTEKYGNGIFKNLGNIIKVIAFVICFTMIAITFVGAFFLFSFDSFFIAIAVGVIILGTIISLITLFLIYGLGHVICQNNEILARLKALMK